MDNKTKKELLRKIAYYSEIDENGCHIWKGAINGKICTVHHNKVHSVHILVWNINNPNDLVNNKIEKCIHLCENDTCVFIDHLAKQKLGKTQLSKTELWDDLLKKSLRQENGCLYWTGSVIKNYGYTEQKGKNQAVHRLSYWIHNDIDELPQEEDTDNFIVRHMCNNKLCFEPTHLTLGSRLDNKKDEVDSGKAVRGINLHNCKIDEEKAKLIKWSKYEPGEENYKTKYERSVMFNVSESLINSIDSGSSWAYIPDRDGSNKTQQLNEKIKKRNREARKKAMTAIWTNDMFDEANKVLDEKSTMSTEIKHPFVTTPCRIWKGTIANDYGTVGIFGKKIRTHILAAEIARKSHKNSNELVRHLCGNSLCCATDHVVFGTQSENSKDMLIHGTNHFSKLTEDQVIEIRKSINDGMLKKEKAKKYGINVNTLRRIEKNETWKHVKIL